MHKPPFTTQTFLEDIPYPVWQITKYTLLMAVLYLLAEIQPLVNTLLAVLLGLCILRLLIVINREPSYSKSKKIGYTQTYVVAAALVAVRLFCNNVWEKGMPYATWIGLCFVLGVFLLNTLYCTFQIKRNAKQGNVMRHHYFQIEETACIALLYCILLL